MSTAASQYLREVKKRIPCSGSQKTEFLCQLEAEVIYYCEDHDSVDFAALSDCFGSPEDVANDFLSELGSNAMNKANLVKQRILLVAAIFIIMAIVSFLGISIHTYYVQQTVLDSHYIESITYEGELTPDMTGPTYEAEYYYSENEILN